MIKLNKYCKVCGKVMEMSLKNSVPNKDDTYYFECEKGHIADFFVPKNMMTMLEEKEEFEREK